MNMCNNILLMFIILLDMFLVCFDDRIRSSTNCRSSENMKIVGSRIYCPQIEFVNSFWQQLKIRQLTELV